MIKTRAFVFSSHQLGYGIDDSVSLSRRAVGHHHLVGTYRNDPSQGKITATKCIFDIFPDNSR
jgi:hypothetical protein